MAYILTGDCVELLRTFPECAVQCCVTSPPYFGLRDYGADGQIGLEATPEEYIAKMVEVFREVRRVLRDDGTLWLNIGDSYAANKRSSSTSAGFNARYHGTEYKEDDKQTVSHKMSSSVKRNTGLHSKQLIGIPWMLAFALRADGWYLRQDIIWHKPNPMPESVTDRCTKAHEYLFLLSKRPRYYFDHDAIKEPAVGQNAHDLTGPGYKAPGQSAQTGSRSKRDTFKRKGSKREMNIPGQTVGTHRFDRKESSYDIFTRNRRSVWTVATRSYKGAHFATFPTQLVEPCVLAGTQPGDVVLDPFNGAGTTGVVALALGRMYVGLEINPEYVALSQDRIALGRRTEP